jgi:hypothetical protein
LLQSQDGHNWYQDIVPGMQQYLQKENTHPVSGYCSPVPWQNVQKENFLGINFSNRVSLEMSELQMDFLWIKMAFHSLGHSSLIETRSNYQL